MDYHKEVTISAAPELLFSAITQSLEKWWGKTDTSVNSIGDEFITSFGQASWKFKIIEFVADQKVTWECTDGQPEFEHEWVGTTLHWQIESSGDKSKLSLTHVGLTPDFDCYDVCAPTWDMFLTSSLKRFVETGKGMPHL